jgi:hypothetical protein
MYQLLVYFPEQRDAHAIVNAHNASDADHHGCERVVVMMGTVRLFAVDCAGNRTP